MFKKISINNAVFHIQFHIGVDDSEVIIDEVLSTSNIVDVLSEPTISTIENEILSNLDRTIANYVGEMRADALI